MRCRRAACSISKASNHGLDMEIKSVRSSCLCTTTPTNQQGQRRQQKQLLFGVGCFADASLSERASSATGRGRLQALRPDSSDVGLEFGVGLKFSGCSGCTGFRLRCGVLASGERWPSAFSSPYLLGADVLELTERREANSSRRRCSPCSKISRSFLSGGICAITLRYTSSSMRLIRARASAIGPLQSNNNNTAVSWMPWLTRPRSSSARISLRLLRCSVLVFGIAESGC